MKKPSYLQIFNYFFLNGITTEFTTEFAEFAIGYTLVVV